MRLLLNLKQGTTTIFFPSPLKGSVLKVNKAKILWTIYNVKDEEIILDSTKETIPTGYYSFDDLKEFLESKNISVVLEKSGKVTITPPSGKTLNLKNLGLLLGFNKDFSFNDKQTSPYLVNVFGGLSLISVFCSRINNYKNFDMGKRSEKLCQVLMPTISVYGMTSVHALETSVLLENGEITSMDFTVVDNSFCTDKDSYNIYLDCEII